MLLCFVDDDDTCTGIHNLNTVGAVPCTDCSPVSCQTGNDAVPCTECSPAVSCTGR
jgi:hypothetical protein